MVWTALPWHPRRMENIPVLSDAAWAEVEQIGLDDGFFAALVHVRRKLGQDLATALTVIPYALCGVAPYGFCVRLLAADPRADGATPVICLFEAYDQPILTAEVAACTGADPWDGEPIALDPARVSLAALRPAFAEYDDEYATLLERFATLRAAGFRFYFRLCAPT